MELKNEYSSLRTFYINNRFKKDEKKKLCYNEIKNCYNETFNANTVSKQFDAFGFTLLHWAALFCQPEEIDRLINEEKIEVNIRSKKYKEYTVDNLTPIWLAALHSNEETIKCLLKHEADIYIQPVNTYYDNGLMD
ncbi:MAG: ankyrin repeat domain-containing protein, partial [Legionella longbeachae]|nr:ankyrin repeat domain-containing protein [Legionella longbeachae]